MSSLNILDDTEPANFPPATRRDFAIYYASLDKVGVPTDELPQNLVRDMLYRANLSDREVGDGVSTIMADAYKSDEQQQAGGTMVFKKAFHKLLNPDPKDLEAVQSALVTARGLDNLRRINQIDPELPAMEQKIVFMMIAAAHEMQIESPQDRGRIRDWQATVRRASQSDIKIN